MQLMTLAQILQLTVQVLIQHKTTLKQVLKRHLILLQKVLLKQINKIKRNGTIKFLIIPPLFY
ncbi:hypothetical protein STRINF_01664 [Streptococcus infantarius subsp. infantarius ATCC BAA-102]|uniref:Uncharacterized protein n=1 Tax=Streptococcus infantarius subsp. infantarius ATCC BAA-102 TaxID=471872 RepID=A0ABM9XBV3_9STRE|nr:hypothetical protein STRINF_01664 [Streptococcus infantarius subsp. infantarius ATCC BAA-102]